MRGRNAVKLAILVTALAALLTGCGQVAKKTQTPEKTKKPAVSGADAVTDSVQQPPPKANAPAAGGRGDTNGLDGLPWPEVATGVAVAAAVVIAVLGFRKARRQGPSRFITLGGGVGTPGQELVDEVAAKKGSPAAGMLSVANRGSSGAEGEAPVTGSGDPVQRLNNRMDMVFPKMAELGRSVDQQGQEIGEIRAQVEELKRTLARGGQAGARGGAWPQQDVVRVADRAAEETQRDLERFRELLSLGEPERQALFRYFDDRSRKVAEVNKVLAEVEKARDLRSYLNSSFYEVEQALERYPESPLPELPSGSWLPRIVPKCAELAEQQARRAVTEAATRLERKGLKKMKIEEGRTRYDSKKHQTTPAEPVRYDNDYPESTIAEEVSSGWELDGRTVKPAVVRIYARKSPGSGTE